MKIQRTPNHKLSGMSRLQRLVGTSALLATLLGAAASASAEVLYVTGSGSQGGQILTADTNTNAVTPVFNTVGTPDGLLFDTSGDILYTNGLGHDVRQYNLTTHLDTRIAGAANGLNTPGDLALGPGGNMFVSDYAGGKIWKIDLNNNNVSTLGTYGGNPSGLAMVGTRLFANLGTRSVGATSFLAELNPVTGAIIGQTTPGLFSVDGLTYDPVKGKLYAPSTLGAGIYEIDPNNLAATPTLLPGSGGVDFDGITTDSAGHLYIANWDGSQRIYQYDFSSHSLIPETAVSGLDDLAPDSGLGSAPEPGTLTLLGTGVAGLAGVLRRRLIA